MAFKRSAVRSRLAQLIEVGCDSLGSVALMDILLKHDTHNGSLVRIDGQLADLMFALVEASAFHHVIAIGGGAAGEVTILRQLAQGRLGSDGSLFALTVSLPEADVSRSPEKVADTS